MKDLTQPRRIEAIDHPRSRVAHVVTWRGRIQMTAGGLVSVHYDRQRAEDMLALLEEHGASDRAYFLDSKEML